MNPRRRRHRRHARCARARYSALYAPHCTAASPFVGRRRGVCVAPSLDGAGEAIVQIMGLPAEEPRSGSDWRSAERSMTAHIVPLRGASPLAMIARVARERPTLLDWRVSTSPRTGITTEGRHEIAPAVWAQSMTVREWLRRSGADVSETRADMQFDRMVADVAAIEAYRRGR